MKPSAPGKSASAKFQGCFIAHNRSSNLIKYCSVYIVIVHLGG